ncbi:hypothetical protein PHBOTO_002552 [Pseudozyma hubeiensis]|nr:hypothetical protein PHBOTO_002552 [Pseudozyma hubeiensis]
MQRISPFGPLPIACHSKPGRNMGSARLRQDRNGCPLPASDSALVRLIVRITRAERLRTNNGRALSREFHEDTVSSTDRRPMKPSAKTEALRNISHFGPLRSLIRMKGTIETGIATNRGIVGILRPRRTSWSTAFNTEAETEF